MPVPGQLQQLPDLARGDPRLREAAHPQQISKISRVTLVVLLDPAVGERLHPERMGQVHLGARRFQYPPVIVKASAAARQRVRFRLSLFAVCDQMLAGSIPIPRCPPQLLP
jgi:hypothetical protein